jgi:hypothetical protein
VLRAKIYVSKCMGLDRFTTLRENLFSPVSDALTSSIAAGIPVVMLDDAVGTPAAYLTDPSAAYLDTASIAVQYFVCGHCFVGP